MNSFHTFGEHFFSGLLGKDPKIRFIKFVFLILVGLGTSYLVFRKGMQWTPELFQNYAVSIGLLGPILYTTIFIIRPLFLIPSIWLFIAGGLVFGPAWGPVYASAGASIGGALAFWIARTMGQDYVMAKLKLGADTISNTQFDFSVVLLLSLLPIMPVTVINYGAGLSNMKFRNYFIAHALGIIPRAFAYGFFGSTLLEIGSQNFRGAILILILMGFVTLHMRLRSKTRVKLANTESFAIKPKLLTNR
jgi:uncharacterized membrane protein YdjX (TVP38/TMEM64 family)